MYFFEHTRVEHSNRLIEQVGRDIFDVVFIEYLISLLGNVTQVWRHHYVIKMLEGMI